MKEPNEKHPYCKEDPNKGDNDKCEHYETTMAPIRFETDPNCKKRWIQTPTSFATQTSPNQLEMVSSP